MIVVRKPCFKKQGFEDLMIWRFEDVQVIEPLEKLSLKKWVYDLDIFKSPNHCCPKNEWDLAIFPKQMKGNQGGSREYRKPACRQAGNAKEAKHAKTPLRPLPPLRSLRYSRLPLSSAMVEFFPGQQ